MGFSTHPFTLQVFCSTFSEEAQARSTTLPSVFAGCVAFQFTKMLNLLSNKKKMADPKAVLSLAVSVAASAVLIRSIINDVVPEETKTYLYSGINYVFRQFSSQLTIVIDEFQGLSTNLVFEAANNYLGTIVSPTVQRLKVSKAENDKSLLIGIDPNEDVVDVYDNFNVTWKLISTKIENSSQRNPGDLNASLKSEVRSYELTFHKKHRERVLDSYIPYIMERAKVIKEENKTIQLHTVDYRSWDGDAVNLKHPMTFKTLAIEEELKKLIIEDLDNFVKGKEFYRKIGRAWKRGYLLYGPPGTGKSSLIASIANHLNYDVYDLDLTEIERNSDLKVLLLGMSNRSILVIEDIDCSLKLKNRESEEEEDKSSQNKVTLSGLLNFIDGLWSSCGEERIIIFTTNHKEKLDPALLRPGRMDMHINLSYCTISVFKQLALNYHGLHHHKLFEQIEELIQKIQVTPAEVAGELIKNKNPEKSLQELLKLVQNKMESLNETRLEEKMEDQIQEQKPVKEI